jgi:hypothetical protein
MLNPFLQPIPTEKRRLTTATEEARAQILGHSIDTASPHPTMGLWVGKLLIRMGEKLANQDHQLKELKEHA